MIIRYRHSFWGSSIYKVVLRLRIYCISKLRIVVSHFTEYNKAQVIQGKAARLKLGSSIYLEMWTLYVGILNLDSTLTSDVLHKIFITKRRAYNKGRQIHFDLSLRRRSLSSLNKLAFYFWNGKDRKTIVFLETQIKFNLSRFPSVEPISNKIEVSVSLLQAYFNLGLWALP